MNKKVRNLIISGVILIVLVGILLLLLFLPQNSSSETEESSTTSYATTSVELFTREEEEMTEISIENEAGSLLLHQEIQGEGDDQESVYSVDGLDGVDQNNEASSLFGSLDSVYASQLVEENPTDLAKYGMDTPTATITIRYSDGTENVLLLGDTLPTGVGCYGMVNDDPNVYALSSSSSPYAALALTDFVDTTVIETWAAPEGSDATEPEIRSMTVVGGKLSETIGDTPFSFEMGEYNDDLASYGMSGSTWVITSPVNASLHTENTQEIRNAASGLSASGVAAIHPDEEMIAEYGLDAPYTVVDFNRDGENFHLDIGASDGSGNRYVMTDGKDVVFIVAESSLPWINIDITKMFSSILYLPFIDDVSQVDLMLYGETYSFDMELSEPEEPEDGEEAEEPSLERVTYNGQELDLDNYRKMYQFFLLAPAEDLNLDGETGDLIASITYHYHDDPEKTDTIEFYQISDRRVALGLNGDISFTSRIAYITRLEQNLEKLLNGEEPDLDY